MSEVIQTARWQPDGNATIAVADIMDSIVVMSLSAPTGSSVVVLQISHDETSNSITFMIIGESPLDIQPCFIHCLQQRYIFTKTLCDIQHLLFSYIRLNKTCSLFP